MTKCMQYSEWKNPSGPLPWGVRAPLSCYFWWMIHGINQHALGLEFWCCFFLDVKCILYKSYIKRYSEWKRVHVGMDPHQPTKLDDTTTLPTSCIILLTVPCVRYLYRTVVEDSGVGNAAWVCNSCWWVWSRCGWLQLNFYWIWEIWSALCYAEVVECMSYADRVCMACWSVSYFVNFFCCWTWHIWVALLVCSYAVGVNRPYIQLLYRSRNCCPCKLHLLSCVQSSHFHAKQP